MIDRDIIDAEIVEEESEPENRIVQVNPELEIERLKTKRAELATTRSARRWSTIGGMVVFSSAFVSCAQMCHPWGG
ncbi:MAG: hypothetical protein KAJ19_08585 [Gammaproteobacteria bacterium]|nr:hypothetical protein [Gammaproteobacteria bacterium]